MNDKVADKSVGKPYQKANTIFRVKCDLSFEKAEVAFALKNIIDKFSTSALRR